MSELPPSAKKSSSAPIRSVPSSSAKTAATVCCADPAGARYSVTGVSVSSGFGSALTSTLPFGVSGISSSTTTAAGTIDSGRCSRTWARSSSRSRVRPGAATT